MEIREEKSLWISTESQKGNVVLSYPLQEPIEAEPGERFEVAINQIAFPNHFPTITADRKRIIMRFVYDGWRRDGEALTYADGSHWEVFFSITLPEGTSMSPERVCDFINRSLRVLLEIPLTSRPVLDAQGHIPAGEYTFCQYIFDPARNPDQNGFLYPDPSYPENRAFFRPLDYHNVGPLYANHFKVPFFSFEDGHLTISLSPPRLEGAADVYYQYTDQHGQPAGVTTTDLDGYFQWHYPAKNDDGVPLYYTNDNRDLSLAPAGTYFNDTPLLDYFLACPAPTLVRIEINTDGIAEQFRDNLMPFLGVAMHIPYVRPSGTARNGELSWEIVNPSFGFSRTPTYISTHSFYDFAKELTGSRRISDNLFSYDQMVTDIVADGEPDENTYDPFVWYYNRQNMYAMVEERMPDAVDLYPRILHICLPQALDTAQVIIGEDISPPSQVIGSVILAQTSGEDRSVYTFQNRIFYGMTSNLLRNIQVLFTVDNTAYRIPFRGMPIHVELHLRRLFDPSSERSRAGASLRADPYLGFRGFQGTDPSRLLLPSGSITHR